MKALERTFFAFILFLGVDRFSSDVPLDVPLPFSKEYGLLSSLERNPRSTSSNIELGLHYAALGEPLLSCKYLKRGIIHGNWSNVTALSNYALQLHHLNQTSIALLTLEIALQLFHNHDPNINFIIGLIHTMTGNIPAAHSWYREVLVVESTPQFYLLIISSFNDYNLYSDAQAFVIEALRKFPHDASVLFACGLNFHFQSKYDLALRYYWSCLSVDPSHDMAITNIASIHQVLGQLWEAKRFYEIAYDRRQHDVSFLNNYGSLLLAMEEYEYGEDILLRAISFNPDQEHALINLAAYYQDEGLLKDTEELLQRAAKNSQNAFQIELRMATLLSPVTSSWSDMLNERLRLEIRLKVLEQRDVPSGRFFQPLMPGLDRIHFYVQYHGFNDRSIQESTSRIYRKFIKDISVIAPRLISKDTEKHHKNNKIKVGFMSKLFGVFEPHGLLLDGVIKYLPRSHFQVIVLEIAPGAQQKILSPTIKDYADEVIKVSLDHVHAVDNLASQDLDILIFADVVSEPMNHFLLQSRFAPIQIAFWGNPITSGSPHVDYFVSADFMEHPFRARMPTSHEPYSEQLVLLSGQGIWYHHPDSPETKKCADSVAGIVEVRGGYSRAEFGLSSEWFIFLCPQSVFKLHPLFDGVVSQILRDSVDAHVVFTSGRRKRWTSEFIKRVKQAVEPVHSNRLHFIERVSSEKFIDFIRIADAILHPFPFDGSRTSADSIAAGVPFVTLPTEYLRGRMGSSFLRTLNIPDLVARNTSDYVRKAVLLSTDTNYYQSVVSKLRLNSWLIWEDMEVPFEWTRFLLSSMGSTESLSFKDFLELAADRNVSYEMASAALRDSNRKMFDDSYGVPHWMLAKDGSATLESTSDAPLRVFNDWK